MIDYKVLQTGSSGNCVIVNNIIALDMGIPYKKIFPMPVASVWYL